MTSSKRRTILLLASALLLLLFVSASSPSPSPSRAILLSRVQKSGTKSLTAFLYGSPFRRLNASSAAHSAASQLRCTERAIFAADDQCSASTFPLPPADATLSCYVHQHCALEPLLEACARMRSAGVRVDHVVMVRNPVARFLSEYTSMCRQLKRHGTLWAYERSALHELGTLCEARSSVRHFLRGARGPVTRSLNRLTKMTALVSQCEQEAHREGRGDEEWERCMVDSAKRQLRSGGVLVLVQEQLTVSLALLAVRLGVSFSGHYLSVVERAEHKFFVPDPELLSIVAAHHRMDLEVYAEAEHLLLAEATRVFGEELNRTLLDPACRFDCPAVDLSTLNSDRPLVKRCRLPSSCRHTVEKLVSQKQSLAGFV